MDRLCPLLLLDLGLLSTAPCPPLLPFGSEPRPPPLGMEPRPPPPLGVEPRPLTSDPLPTSDVMDDVTDDVTDSVSTSDGRGAPPAGLFTLPIRSVTHF